MTANSRNSQNRRPQRASAAHASASNGQAVQYSRSAASRQVSQNSRVGARTNQHVTAAPNMYNSRYAAAQRNQYSRNASAYDGGLNMYRRNNYEPPKQKGSKKRVLLKILIPVAVVLLLCVGLTLWYMAQLDDALSLNAENEQAVSDVLVPASLDKPFYMLVLGSDSREGSGTSNNAAESGDNQRSDVMMLLRVDAKNRLMTMVSIPRDTPITLKDGSVAKINEAYNIGGAAYSIEKVSELVGVGISHYAEIHFSEFEEVVDKIGGVTIDVPVEISHVDALTGETITLQPGTQTLDGQQAQIFVRARKMYEGNQDAKRQDNTRVLMMAMMQKVLDKPLPELPGAALDLATCMGTDFNSNEILPLVFSYATGSGKMTVYSGSGPTDGAIDEATGLWLCYENPEAWANLMQVVNAGEDPSKLNM